MDELKTAFSAALQQHLGHPHLTVDVTHHDYMECTVPDLNTLITVFNNMLIDPERGVSRKFLAQCFNSEIERVTSR